MAPRSSSYLRYAKRVGLLYAAWICALAIVIILVALLNPPEWLARGGFVAVVICLIAATALVVRSLRRGQPQQRIDSPARPPHRLTLVTMIRILGWPGFLLSVISMLGVPLTIAGAVTNVRALLIVGLVLVAAQLVNMAIILPLRRARARPSTSNGTSQRPR